MITTRSSRGWIFILGLALVPADIAASTTGRCGNRNNSNELALSGRECQHGAEDKRGAPAVKRRPGAARGAGWPGGTRRSAPAFQRLTRLPDPLSLGRIVTRPIAFTLAASAAQDSSYPEVASRGPEQEAAC